MSYYGLINSMSRGLGSSPPLILNTYTGASLGFSVYKINNTYNGDCVLVRRSSDNTEQGFGFVGNLLDTASILSFVGSGSGFITKWYNQTGNGNDASQSTTSLQPIIVNSGSLVTINGLPAMNFNSRFLSFTSITLNSNWAVFSVGIANSGQRFVPIAGSQTTPVATLMRFTDNKYYTIRGSGYAISTTSDSSASQMLLSGIISSSGISMRKNGTAISDTEASGSYNNTISQIGKYGSTELGDAFFQEVLFWNTDQDANKVGIEADIKSRYTSIP